MGSKKRTIGILIVVIVVLLGFAGSLLVYRNKLSSENTKNSSNDNTTQSLSSVSSQRYLEDFYDKPITDEKIALDSIETNRVQLGYDDENITFRFITENGYLGASYRFKILYKNIPIHGESIIVSADKNGIPDLLVSSQIEIKKLNKINTTPKITQDEAIDIVKKQLNTEESVKPELIIYEVNKEYILAYYVNTLFNVCVVDAETGDIVNYRSTLVSKSDEFIGQTGDKHRVFYDDYNDENYNIENALLDKEKNIYIYNDISTYEEIKVKDNMLSLDDIQSGKNKSAIDGMANTYRAVEYFEKLNKELGSIFDLICVNVNAELEDENGNIIQNQAMGGCHKIDGSDICILSFCVMSDDATPQYSAYLDAVAHEYTHAVTNLKAFGLDGYSKDSRYFERNALMEAYSDIFGELIEQRYTGKTDWNNNKNRNLVKQEKDRSYYKYKYSEKYIGSEDDGGAHYNSTIISHTAYLMSKDNKISKYEKRFLLDYDELALLWYGSLDYLKDTSTFSDCRIAVSRSAMKLIKDGALTETSLSIIEQAFDEVEVKTNYSITNSGSQAMEIIKDKNTLVVPVEDETQSSEPVEIKELNYTWHLDPTIEAEDIIVSDDSIYTIFCDTKASDTYSIIKKNGKYTMIDYDGQLVTEDIYDRYYFADAGEIGLWRNDTSPYSFIACGDQISKDDYGLARGMTGGWAGFCYDSSNKTVYADRCFEYEIFDGNIEVEGSKTLRAVLVQSANVTKSDNDDFYDVESLGKYGIAFENKLIVDTIYDEGRMSLYNDMIALKKGDKWGYFNGQTGEQIIDFVCNDISLNLELIRDNNTGEVIREVTYPYVFSDNYLAIYTDFGCGYYDTEGNEVIPCGTFEEVRPVHNGLAWVKKDGKWGVIELENIEQETEQIDLTVNVDCTYIGELTKDGWTCYYTMNVDKDGSLFTVSTTTTDGIEGGFDLPITKVENGVYFYTGGSAYDRSQTGGRINAVNGLTGTITVNNDGTLLWKTEDSLPFEIILKPEIIEDEKNIAIGFSVKDYEGIYYPVHSDFNLQMEVKIQSESSVDIKITFTNDTGTRVSENIFSGNIESIPIHFETDDGYGRNSFTLDFKNDKIYLTGKCIKSDGLWGLPEMNKIEMQSN